MSSCGRCSRDMAKGHKRHRDVVYCGTCYARLFKRALCRGCGNFRRLFTEDPRALCTTCERARPCVRCERVGRPIGKMTEFGPACASCYRYFATPRPCPSCGDETVDWYRPAAAGAEPGAETDATQAPSVCVRCADIYKTCWVCRRSRRCTQNGNGHWLCEPCMSGEAGTCGDCSAEIPKGSGSRCVDCYWRARSDTHAQQLQYLVREGVARQAFLDFVPWAVAGSDPKRIAMGLTRNVEFFALLAKLPRPDWASENLLKLFGADGLRKYELATRWMEQVQGVVVASEDRLESAERRRARGQLEQVPVCEPAHALIEEFSNILQTRLEAGEISARTARTTLRPAVDLMQLAGWREVPTQGELEKYLAGAPGQRAALFAFLTFLRATHGAELAMPPKKSGKRATTLRRVQEKELNRLLDEAPRPADFERRWLVHALAYFHRMSLVDARRLLAGGSISSDTEGYVLTHESGQFWLPRPPEPVEPLQRQAPSETPVS